MVLVRSIMKIYHLKLLAFLNVVIFKCLLMKYEIDATSFVVDPIFVDKIESALPCGKYFKDGRE